VLSNKTPLFGGVRTGGGGDYCNVTINRSTGTEMNNGDTNTAVCLENDTRLERAPSKKSIAVLCIVVAVIVGIHLLIVSTSLPSSEFLCFSYLNTAPRHNSNVLFNI